MLVCKSAFQTLGPPRVATLGDRSRIGDTYIIGCATCRDYLNFRRADSDIAATMAFARKNMEAKRGPAIFADPIRNHR